MFYSTAFLSKFLNINSEFQEITILISLLERKPTYKLIISNHEKILVISSRLGFGQNLFLVGLFLRRLIIVQLTTGMNFTFQEKDSNFCSTNILGDDKKTT